MDFIQPKHIAGAPIMIGHCEGDPVLQLLTKGGWWVVGRNKDKGKFEILGAGSHKKIARAVARRQNENVVFTELSKSEHIDISLYESLLPDAEELTQKLRSLNGDE